MLATWNRRAPAPVPFGSLGNDVEETLDALLGFGRSERMVERAQLRNEIAGLLARRTPAPSPAYTEPTAKECLAVYAEALTKADVPGSIPSERHRAGIEAVLAFCLNRAPDAEYLKSYAEAVLKANTAPSPATGESASPPSEQTAKELDELLAVFAKGDGDDEDCWTQPARRAQLYVASLRAEVERLRTALAEKEKAGVNANAVVERCIELVVRKKTPSWDEVSVWCDALRTALGAKETK